MIVPWPEELSANIQSLSAEMVSALRLRTDELARETAADLIAIVDESGCIVVKSGGMAGRSGDEVGVLAAAVSASTSALAASLGAGRPQEILQHCGKHSFLLSSITPQCQLLVVFGVKYPAGMIRLATEEAIAELREVPGIPGGAAIDIN